MSEKDEKQLVAETKASGEVVKTTVQTVGKVVETSIATAGGVIEKMLEAAKSSPAISVVASFVLMDIFQKSGLLFKGSAESLKATYLSLLGATVTREWIQAFETGIAGIVASFTGGKIEAESFFKTSVTVDVQGGGIVGGLSKLLETSAAAGAAA